MRIKVFFFFCKHTEHVHLAIYPASQLKCSVLHITKVFQESHLPWIEQEIIGYKRIHILSAPESQGTCSSDLTADREKLFSSRPARPCRQTSSSWLPLGTYASLFMHQELLLGFEFQHSHSNLGSYQANRRSPYHDSPNTDLLTFITSIQM